MNKNRELINQYIDIDSVELNSGTYILNYDNMYSDDILAVNKNPYKMYENVKYRENTIYGQRTFYYLNTRGVNTKLPKIYNMINNNFCLSRDLTSTGNTPYYNISGGYSDTMNNAYNYTLVKPRNGFRNVYSYEPDTNSKSTGMLDKVSQMSHGGILNVLNTPNHTVQRLVDNNGEYHRFDIKNPYGKQWWDNWKYTPVHSKSNKFHDNIPYLDHINIFTDITSTVIKRVAAAATNNKLYNEFIRYLGTDSLRQPELYSAPEIYEQTTWVQNDYSIGVAKSVLPINNQTDSWNIATYDLVNLVQSRTIKRDNPHTNFSYHAPSKTFRIQARGNITWSSCFTNNSDNAQLNFWQIYEQRLTPQENISYVYKQTNMRYAISLYNTYIGYLGFRTPYRLNGSLDQYLATYSGMSPYMSSYGDAFFDNKRYDKYISTRELSYKNRGRYTPSHINVIHYYDNYFIKHDLSDYVRSFDMTEYISYMYRSLNLNTVRVFDRSGEKVKRMVIVPAKKRYNVKDGNVTSGVVRKSETYKVGMGGTMGIQLYRDFSYTLNTPMYINGKVVYANHTLLNYPRIDLKNNNINTNYIVDLRIINNGYQDHGIQKVLNPNIHASEISLVYDPAYHIYYEDTTNDLYRY